MKSLWISASAAAFKMNSHSAVGSVLFLKCSNALIFFEYKKKTAFYCSAPTFQNHSRS